MILIINCTKRSQTDMANNFHKKYTQEVFGTKTPRNSQRNVMHVLSYYINC